MVRLLKKIYKLASVASLLICAFFLGRWIKTPTPSMRGSSDISQAGSPSSPVSGVSYDEEMSHADPLLRARMLKSQADILRADGQLADAARNYIHALSLKFTDARMRARLHLSLGDTLGQQGEYEKGCESYMQGLAITHEDTRLKAYLYNNLSGLLKKQKRFEEAVHNYQIALSLTLRFDRLKAILLCGLGEAQTELNQFQEAIMSYTEALGMTELDDSHRLKAKNSLQSTLLRRASYYEKEGMALLHEGKTDQAITKFKMALATNGIAPSLTEKLEEDLALSAIQKAEDFMHEGIAHLENGEHLHATHSFEEALKVNFECNRVKAQIHENLSKAQSALGNVETALNHLEQAIAIADLDSDMYDQLSLFRTELNEQKAEQYLARGAESMKIGNCGGALDLFRKGLELSQSSSSVYETLQSHIQQASNMLSTKMLEEAAALENLGRTSEAIALYSKSLEMNSCDNLVTAKTRLTLGDLYLKNGNSAKALATYQKALEIEVEDELLTAVLHLKAGDVLQFLNKYEEAESHYGRALAMNPSYSRVRALLQFSLGKTLTSQKKIEEAIHFLEMALDTSDIEDGFRNDIAQHLERALTQRDAISKHLGSSLYAAARPASKALSLPEVVNKDEQEIQEVEEVAAISISTLLDEAHELLEGELFEKATALFNEVLSSKAASQDECAQAEYGLGLNALAHMNLSEAEALFAKAAQREEISSRTAATLSIALGQSLKRQGKLEDAITAFKQGLQLDELPNETIAALNKQIGNALVESGQYDLAYEYYQDQGGIVKAEEVIAESAIENVEEEVIASISEVESSPEGVRTLLEQGELDAAADLANVVALQVKSGNKRALLFYNIGNAYFDANKVEAAASLYEKALRAKLKSQSIKAFIYNDLGNAYHILGNHKAAISNLNKGLTCAAQDHKVRSSLCFNLGSAYALMNEPSKSAQYLRRALKSGGVSAELKAAAHTKLASALVAMGKEQEALTHYEEVIAIAPEDKELLANAHQNLGTALQNSNKLDEAIDHMRVAIDLSSKNIEMQSDLYKQLGLALFKQGKMEESAKFYSQGRTLAGEIEESSVDIAEN